MTGWIGEKNVVVGNEKETPISYHLYDKINFIHILTRDIYISVSRQVYAQASNLHIHSLPTHTHMYFKFSKCICLYRKH